MGRSRLNTAYHLDVGSRAEERLRLFRVSGLDDWVRSPRQKIPKRQKKLGQKDDFWLTSVEETVVNLYGNV